MRIKLKNWEFIPVLFFLYYINEVRMNFYKTKGGHFYDGRRKESKKERM